MSRTTRLLLTFGVLSIVVWLLDLLPQVNGFPELPHFAGGFGVGLLIAALISLLGGRGG